MSFDKSQSTVTRQQRHWEAPLAGSEPPLADVRSITVTVMCPKKDLTTRSLNSHGN
jgi:hypothetical protein